MDFAARTAAPAVRARVKDCPGSPEILAPPVRRCHTLGRNPGGSGRAGRTRAEGRPPSLNRPGSAYRAARRRVVGQPRRTGEEHAGRKLESAARLHAEGGGCGPGAGLGRGHGSGRDGGRYRRPGRRYTSRDGRGACGRPDLFLPSARPVPDPRPPAQPGRVGIPRHSRSLRGPAEPGRRRQPRAGGGDRLHGVRRQHHLYLRAPHGRPLVERRPGDRPRLRLRLAAGRRSRDRLALRVVPRAHRDGQRQGDPGRREGSVRARGAGGGRPYPRGEAEHALALLPRDDHLRHPLSRAPGDHRGPWRAMDGAREHGLERRLRPRGDGAQRIPLADQEPDVLGCRRGHHREGHRSRHQRRQPGPHPLPRRRARPPRAAPARAVSGPRGGAARRGEERPPPVLVLLRHQPHREHEPRPRGRAGATGARHGHRPRRDRRSGAEGRPVAGLQLHPLQDGELRDAGTSRTRVSPRPSGTRRRSG